MVQASRMRDWRNSLALGAYPGILVLAISWHLYLVDAHSLMVATYLPVFWGVLAVTLLEIFTPERQEWHPTRAEVGNDATYMVVIQLLLPRLLAFACVVMLVEPLHAHGWITEGYWPHDWPVATQVILMLLVADFFRYWLHRFAHEYAFLWRFHAVHHSVPKLYWLNVGRFHYVDKSLQFLLDAFPFLLLGVNEQVLALYFVFYSINGFFQHSNIRLRLGILNYVISTAELHRWHHSRVSKESNTNYGNNIILWDTLFGTRFLPNDRKVEALGLQNTHYPYSFLAQLKTPYIDGINQRETALLGYGEILRNGLIWIGMIYSRIRLWRPLDKASRHPRASQLALLNTIMVEYRATRFGREHHFGEIHSHRDYVDHVPVQTYEDLRPYIQAQQETGKPELTPVPPSMYALTSGTTGQPKLLPVLEVTLRQQRRNQRIFSYLQYRHTPEAFAGKMLGIMGAPVEGYLDNGIPYGSVSGLLYLNMPGIMHGKYVVPPEVFDVHDYELKYLLILRLAMAEQNITYMGGANPSTFLRLQSLITGYGSQLVDDIRNGDFFRVRELDKTLQDGLKTTLQARPARADALQAMLSRQPLRIADIWPYLRLLSTWTGGSCGALLGQLREVLPARTRIMDLGYIASEFRGTIPVSDTHAGGIPLLTDNFYEFVRKEDWESGQCVFLLLDQLEAGQDYYIFITTRSGLFRYQMDDIVRVTDWYHKTPLLCFIQKGAGITSITGEKLYENQVLTAMQAVCGEWKREIPFFLLLADRDNAGYEVYLESDMANETFAKRLDQKLANINMEYEAKRDSGRLEALKVFALKPATGEAYKQYLIQAGQREGQYKPVLLQYKDELAFPIKDYLES